MRISYFIAALSALLATGRPLRAQRGSGSLSGDVFDTVSRLPVRRATVCERAGHVVICRRADSLGHFIYGPVNPGEHIFSVSCDNGKKSILIAAKLLETLQLTLREREQRVVRLRVDATGCDQRGFEVRFGQFRGHYTSGFELSDFVPCEGSPGHPAWVEWSEKARRQPQPGWPDIGGDQSEQRVYVRWIGTTEGPYRYGHMSVATYELRVDSVIEVRAPGANDCPAEPK